jgi:hypothetical protein
MAPSVRTRQHSLQQAIISSHPKGHVPVERSRIVRSRVFAVGLVVVVALLVLTGCEALDELGEGAATPGVETPGAAVTPPEGMTPGAELTPTEAITSEADVTPTEEATPEADMTPGGAITATETVSPGIAITATETGSPGIAITPTETVTPGADITPTETVTPGAAITATETVSPGGAAPGEPPEELVLADLGDLEQFDSYRTISVVTWTPDTGDATVIEALVEATVQGGLAGVGREATQHTVITLTQGTQEAQRLEFVSRGEQTWNRVDDQWAEVSVAPTDLLDQVGWIGHPSAILAEDARGAFIATETVDGMELWHYRYPPQELAEEQRFAELEDAELQAWVAAEHNILWRLELIAMGIGPEGGSGTLALVSMVDSVNVPIDFPVPPELALEGTPEPGATPEADATPTAEDLPETGVRAPDVLTRNDIPLVEGANAVRALGNVVILQVESTPAEVIAFYTDELEAMDWTRTGPESNTTARFTQDGRSVSIAVAPSEQAGESTVFIAVDEG